MIGIGVDFSARDSVEQVCAIKSRSKQAVGSAKYEASDGNETNEMGSKMETR
jgi:hypothetical protein